MNDTPRTDAMEEHCYNLINVPVNAVPGAFARLLELELASMTSNFGAEKERADIFQRQRDDARDQRDELRESLRLSEPFMRHDLNCHARTGYQCHCGMEKAQFKAKELIQ